MIYRKHFKRIPFWYLQNVTIRKANHHRAFGFFYGPKGYRQMSYWEESTIEQSIKEFIVTVEKHDRQKDR